MSIIERKLKESEERFKALFKGGPVPTYAWQKFENSFKLIDYNIAAENITQGNVEKFLGVAASEMYKSRPEIVKDLNICFNEKKNIIREMKYSFSSSEEVKDLLVTYSYIPPDLVLVHTEDVTQSKRAKEKLKESEQRYRSLFNNMNAGFAYHKVITDDNNTPIDYEYIEVNPAFEKFTGLKAKEMIGKKVTEVLPGTENDPADWIGKFGNVGLTGVPLVVEDYSEALDRWYRVSGYSPKKGYFAVTFTEITDQKKTQLKLADSEEKYRKLYNNAPFAIVLFSLDGIILDCNDSTKRITGYSKEDLAGKNFKDFNFYVEPDLANIKEREDQVKNGKIPGVRDILLKKKDGSEFWAKTQIEFVSMGDITYIQAIIQDVSEEKLAQIKLNKSENLLKEKVKELNCLYELSKIGEKLDVSLNEIMNEFLNLIQNAWQFPALICARISFEGKSYTTENFNETSWLLDTQVEINKKPLVINVYYLQDNPSFDEEKDLLKEIGIRVKIILERKESEERLRESEEKYRKVIEQSQDGVVLVDEDAEIIEWNKAQEKIFGKKKDEVLGKKLWEVQYEAFPKDSRSQEIMEKNKISIIEAIKTGKAPWINVLQEMITIDTKGKHHIIQQI
ncbi:MAG: PAS domain S-box protein, partial [Candidatus Heimdallarchaeota archaeon]